jgi:hypothetical protein
MITMQYRIALPADYDMDIIRRRIAERGHLTDDFPQLSFKAYLYADRSVGPWCALGRCGARIRHTICLSQHTLRAKFCLSPLMQP